jgi:hypothetical protein
MTGCMHRLVHILSDQQGLSTDLTNRLGIATSVGFSRPPWQFGRILLAKARLTEKFDRVQFDLRGGWEYI